MEDGLDLCGESVGKIYSSALDGEKDDPLSGL